MERKVKHKVSGCEVVGRTREVQVEGYVVGLKGCQRAR